MHEYADAFTALSFGSHDVKVLEILDTEQQHAKVLRNDMTFKAPLRNLYRRK